MQPLATHMAAQRLVRARSYAGAPVRHLDRGLLRERYVIDQMVTGAPTPVDADLLAQYVAGSLLALQALWLEHDLPHPPRRWGASSGGS